MYESASVHLAGWRWALWTPWGAARALVCSQSAPSFPTSDEALADLAKFKALVNAAPTRVLGRTA